jgi:hypothetical protein
MNLYKSEDSFGRFMVKQAAQIVQIAIELKAPGGHREIARYVPIRYGSIH